MYSEFLKMVYDFLNMACNTNYFVFIIYFVTTINFIIAIYELVIGVIMIVGAPAELQSGFIRKVNKRDSWYKVHGKKKEDEGEDKK